MGRLVSVGEVMVELAATDRPELFRQGFAGDTFNTAWHARRELPDDWTVSYVTALGRDSLSDRLAAFIAGAGIDTAHIRRLEGRAPGLYMIELDAGERSFHYWREMSAARALADDAGALARAFDGAAAIYLSGITLAILAPGPRATLLACLRAARAAGAVVAFDSNLRPRLWPSAAAMAAAIGEMASIATLALPTVPDETDLFGEPDAAAVARRYLDAGAAEVVVRAGSGAALVCWPGGRAEVAPERRITPVDTTGAGDSFNGAYLAARLQGVAPPEAARRAHAVAGRVIGAHGALV